MCQPLYIKNMKTFDFRISMKLEFLAFKHDLTRFYKNDILSLSNRFIDYNSGIPGEWGRMENVSIRQMFKTSYILKIDNF